MRIVNMERKLIYFTPIFLSMVSMTAASCSDSGYPYDTHYECKLMIQIQSFIAAFWIAALAVNYIIIFTKPAAEDLKLFVVRMGQVEYGSENNLSIQEVFLQGKARSGILLYIIHI